MIRKDIEKHLLSVQKPCRYTGGEPGSIIKNKDDINLRFAFCFPDTYEIGMSHLGMKILYGLYNAQPDVWCERVFAPAADMEAVLRREGIPLYALESGDSIRDFDFVGFTLQYELSYSTMLNMLDLAGIPMLAAERNDPPTHYNSQFTIHNSQLNSGAINETAARISFELHNYPIVIAGGPCTCNPEPLSDFIDLFVLGEGEEVSLELFDLYQKMKASGEYRKEIFLIQAAKIEGVYVPSLYDVKYNQDGTIESINPKDEAPEEVRKAVVRDFEKSYFPDGFIVPFAEIVHDRAVSEIMRGCIRGCRFCQAGFLYRPLRERAPETVSAQCRSLCENTGYDEVSLSSLSSSDYTELNPLLDDVHSWSVADKVSVSLPSLRVDNFSVAMTEKLGMVRRGGLTFAPEAGTQRMRDVINKNVTREQLLSTAVKAFNGGWSSIKLYFMMGLPTETDEDIIGIGDLAQAVVDAYYHNPDREKGRGVTVTASAAVFVPKAFTPFQWEPQDTIEIIKGKQKLLRESVRSRKITLNWHDSSTSFLEAVFARGDRRLGKVLLKAFELGCKFDGWSEHFSIERWMPAFESCGVDPAFYANRRRDYCEVLPWDHLDYGISKEFLIAEMERALAAEVTPNCREKCMGCGVTKLGVGCRGKLPLSLRDIPLEEGDKKAFLEEEDKKASLFEGDGGAAKKVPLLEGDVNAVDRGSMIPVRIFFSKTGEAVYMSHLDLMRCFSRALRRSGLPFWYTEGFNPHPFSAFALPLALGTTGLREAVDIKLAEHFNPEEVPEKLNPCLPDGIKILSAAIPVKKPKEIAHSVYLIKFYDQGITQSKVEAFFALPEIMVTKLNKKKKEVEIDIKSMMGEWSVDDEGLRIMLPSGSEQTLNPNLLINALAAFCGAEDSGAQIIRERILDADGKDFA